MVFESVCRPRLLAPRSRQPLMSENFQNQLTFFCMTPSFAFVREPETSWLCRC
jgi:hypothetical protein